MIIKSKISLILIFLLGLVFYSCAAKPQAIKSSLSKKKDSTLFTNKSSSSNRLQVSHLVSHDKPSKTVQQKSFTQWHQAPTQAVLPQAIQRSSVNSSLTLSHLTNKKLLIGVLLPLSGPHQSWGRLIKNSLEYLQKRYPNLIFKFADTQSDPLYALKALDLWMMRTRPQSKRVDVLLGPLSPQVILHLSQRIQWYEIPWFPLGSLPTLSINHVNFSWRLEAQDEAQALANYLCMHRKQAQIILLDQPKNRLITKKLQRLLKSCRVRLTRVVILNKTERKKSDAKWRVQLDQADLFTHKHADLHKHSPSSTVILARGKPLYSIISLLVRMKANARPNHSSSDYLVTSLGSCHMIGRMMNQLSDQNVLEGMVCLERPALAQKGQLYMKEKPTTNSLELELADLLLWLKSAQKLSEQTRISLVQAIRKVSRVHGQWGIRKQVSGRLLPATILYYQVHNNRLKASSLELLSP